MSKHDPAITDLSVEILEGRVAALEAAHVAARDAGGWPGTVTRLIRRDVFEEGDALHSRYLHVRSRVAQLRREHRELDGMWEAVNEALRAGKFGDGVYSADNADALQQQRADLGDRLREKWAEIESAEAERDELERALGAFTAVEVRGVQLPSGDA